VNVQGPLTGLDLYPYGLVERVENHGKVVLDTLASTREVI
jgi:hypothetical protein